MEVPHWIFFWRSCPHAIASKVLSRNAVTSVQGLRTEALPSLKLTPRPWNLSVARVYFCLWGPTAYFAGAFAVRFKEGKSFWWTYMAISITAFYNRTYMTSLNSPFSVAFVCSEPPEYPHVPHETTLIPKGKCTVFHKVGRNQLWHWSYDPCKRPWKIL